MKRRQFIASSIATPLLAGSAFRGRIKAEDEKARREYYELRMYHLRRGPKQKLFDDFFREVSLPAMNRNGIGPVGVFSVMVGPDSPTMYLLIPHKSIESLATATDRVTSDPEYQKAGASFINLPASDPAYVRVESSLMVAFSAMPRLEAPKKQPRIFELRTYESPNKRTNQKKIEMFNTAEIGI